MKPDFLHSPASVSTSPSDVLRWEGHMADDGGSTFGMEPTASLSATTEELVLSGSRGTYRLPRASVTKIGRGSMYPWFFSSVGLRHSAPGVSRGLQFKPLDVSPREVIQALAGLGYPV